MATLELDDRGILTACSNCGQKNRMAYSRMGDPIRCARCKTDLAGTTAPLDVYSGQDFDTLIAKASVPIVVDYWAPWCGPCRMVAPELAKVAARSAGRFLVVKVNTDILSDLGARFGIRSIPTMAVFAGGREVTRTVGAQPAAEIEAFIERCLPQSSR